MIKVDADLLQRTQERLNDKLRMFNMKDDHLLCRH